VLARDDLKENRPVDGESPRLVSVEELFTPVKSFTMCRLHGCADMVCG